MAVYGNGDAAIDDILEAFAAAQKAHPRPDARHRIEHCPTAREDQLIRMKQLGVTPSFFVAHVYYWGNRHRDIFLSPERAARISPLADALRHQVRFTVHNDTSVTPINPLQLAWTAVNRASSSGKVLGKEQTISMKDALRSITSEAAWQNFEEKETWLARTRQARRLRDPGSQLAHRSTDGNPQFEGVGNHHRRREGFQTLTIPGHIWPRQSFQA